MSLLDKILKRGLDVVVSLFGLLVLWPVIGVAWLLAAWDTKTSGMFHQERVGRNGKMFTIYKLRTMWVNNGSTITSRGDARITPLGAKLRRLKIDELPQLWNVLIGEMSLVGPRPDVAGYMDALEGEDREILALRPGITGPASLKYRDEETLLAESDDPKAFNDDVIWPDKVRINRDYIRNYSLGRDIRYLLATAHLADHGVR